MGHILLFTIVLATCKRGISLFSKIPESIFMFLYWYFKEYLIVYIAKEIQGTVFVSVKLTPVWEVGHMQILYQVSKDRYPITVFL